MKVEMHSDLLTVQVSGGALSEVLEAVGAQANLKVIAIGGEKIADKIGEASVSADFTNLPLEQGISRILSGWDYALINDQGTKRLKEIYIVARTETDQVSSSIQIEALRQLTEFQDGHALEALKQALQSRNPAVRLTALEIMFVQKVRDGAALEVTRELSISDPHPEVRGKALTIVRRFGPTKSKEFDPDK